MSASGALKERIQLLQAAKARADATGRELKDDVAKELESYRSQGLLGGRGGGSKSGSVPQWAKKDFEEPFAQFSALDRAVSGFKDDYAGNTLTGGLENTAQSLYSGFGTEGQRDYWAQVANTDNVIRNKLFGAALTPGEAREYEKTTVTPSMDPKIVRQNLTTRRDIIKKAVARQYKFLQAQGYNEDAIDALAGEYAPEFNPQIKAERDAARAQMEGGGPASTVGGGTDGSGSPPVGDGTKPDGTLTFKDELPPELINKVELSPQQSAQIADFIRSGGATVEQIQKFANVVTGGKGTMNAEAAEKLRAYYSDPKNRGVAPTVYADNEVKPVDNGGGSVDAFARGVASNIPFSTEIASGIETLADPNSTYADNLQRNQGIKLFQEENNGTARTLGAIAGAAPLGGIGVESAANAARGAAVSTLRSGGTRAAAELAAARAYAGETAKVSSAMGGTYSLGNADGDAVDRIASGAVGAGVGALTGSALAYGGSRFASRLAARSRNAAAPVATEGQETLAAMERQGVTPFAPDVGGAKTRLATAGTAQTLGGVGPIRRAAQETLDTSQAVRDRVAASFGVAENPEGAGEVARAGANAFKAQTSARIGRIYDQAEQAAGTTAVETPEALRVLNQELGPLEESAVPSAGLSVLQGLRDGLSTPTTIRGIRATRTQLRSAFENTGQRGSNEERIAGRVLDAAADDITTGLRAAGQDTAARQYRVADRMWRERLRIIDEHLEPILGDDTGARAKSGEQVVKGLMGAMSGNNRRFVGFINALPPEEQGIVRASLISRLGQAPKGQQDAAGEAFSLGTFLTHWNDIGDTAKARLFGSEGRAAINDLATIAEGAKQAQKYANFSNTGAAVTTSTLGGLVAAGPVGWITAAKIFGGTYASGRLLASPRFARWIARPPRQATPQQAQAYVARLTRIARAEPAIAADVLQIQQRLREVVGQSVARGASEEGNGVNPNGNGGND